MPPLLPEYLSQPVQIVVQSSSTDWVALLAGGVFTLLGALSGAWLGAKGAYASTVKARKHELYMQKLDEIISLIDIESYKVGVWYNIFTSEFELNKPEEVRGSLIKNFPIRDSSTSNLRKNITYYCPASKSDFSKVYDLMLDAEVLVLPLTMDICCWSDVENNIYSIRHSLLDLLNHLSVLRERVSAELKSFID